MLTPLQIDSMRRTLRRALALRTKLGREWIKAALIEHNLKKLPSHLVEDMLIQKGLEEPHNVIEAMKELPKLRQEIKLGQFE